MRRTIFRRPQAGTPRLLLLVIFLMALLPAAPARAATIFFVDPTGSDSNTCLSPIINACKTIGGAIGKAASGDTINVTAGTYVENLTITKSLTLSGAGAGLTIIDGNQADTVVSIDGSISVAITGVTIQNGTAGLHTPFVTYTTICGGGIYNKSATVTLNNSVVRDNHSSDPNSKGGGIYNQAGTLTINGGVITGNTAGEVGSGIYNYLGSVIITNTTVSENGSLMGAWGGGIYSEGGGAVSIVTSTISNNASLRGAGVFILAGSASITNSTISGNSASQHGGGIEVGNAFTSATVTVSHSTIANNHAGSGGGVYSYVSGTAQISNSILAGNNASTGAPDCAGESGNGFVGQVVSQGYNRIGNITGCTFTPAAGDQVGTASNPIDPRLGALKDNGGPTKTMAPLAGSPALDAIPNGVNGCGATVTTDQRGIARPFGGRCDIGAYEANGTATSLVFAAQPQGGQAGAPLAIQPVVGAQDANGNGASFSGSVTLALNSGSGAPGATLGGSTTRAATNSTASFSGLTLSPAGTGYLLNASGAGPAAGLAAAESAPFGVATPPAQPPAPEVEPNNTVAQATPIVLEASGHAGLTGKIDSGADIDLYSFTTRPGATAAISLTNLPADYDLALVPDPRVTIPLSDSIDLGKIADISAPIPDISKPIPDISAPIPDIGAGVPSASQIIARSTQRGAASESISAYLSHGGTYFVLVFSHTNAATAKTPYQLDVTLHDGALASATTSATPVAALNLTPDKDVRTIYLYNSQRLASQYRDDLGAVRELTSTLQANSSLLTASATISKGVALDLGIGSTQLGSTLAISLTQLYNRWDNAPDQPLLANQVAQQIYNILDRAITNYYTGTTDIVIVGGDSIIPFYRVPDETEFANESQYGATLRGAGTARLGSALDGSLFRRFIQTDDFYADRAPTPWRGRALFLPDLGVGRLVERPSEIMHYLSGYLASKQYTIDASGSSAAAMVSGYDFLKDQAGAIAQQLDRYGFKQNGVLGTSQALRLLNNDTWGLNQFTDLWFSGQLPKLGAGYSGRQTRYSLTSLNGHFTYNSAIPASSAGGVFNASRIYTPTALADADAFFKIKGAPTLIYTIGCHSGLNVNDDDIATPSLRADFPQAVLKQGGNWIGNTGYGYGDSNVIGYSERLSLLFTQAIGRTVNRNGYIGASIGDALARAKRQYLKTSGGNSFSVYDEKVLEELTLYGLPFLRVKVPHPTPPGKDEPAPAPIPTAIRATLAETANNGVFTRVVTMTNSFSPLDSSGLVSVTSTLQDSFVPSTTLTSTQQTAIGKPVLPLLAYNITLLKNPDVIKKGGADGIPIPRGVQLRSATMLPDQSGFDPRVTSTITDRIGLQPRLDPQLAVRGAWLPTLPYTTQRTNEISATQVITSDKLLVFPAQFNPTSSTAGQLRRYTQMVFEITYIDPRSAPAAIRNASDPPVFDTAEMALLTGPAALATLAANGLSVRLSAAVSAPGGLHSISATYTNDGQSWRRQPLVRNPTTHHYEATISVAGGKFYALLEAIDNAGNVAVTSNKGTQFALSQVYLPLGRR